MVHSADMKLKKYWSSLDSEQRKELARRMKTSVGTIANLACGHGSCSADFAMDMEIQTQGEVPVEEMHPHAGWAFIRGTAKKKNRSGGLRTAATRA